MCKSIDGSDAAEKGDLIPPKTPKETEKGKKGETDALKFSTEPSLKKIFMMAEPEFLMMVVTLIFIIASEASNLVIPLIVADAYDTIIFAGENETKSALNGEVNKIMGLALTIYFAGTFVGFLRTTIQGIIGERLVARLRCKLYSAILKQEIAFFDEHSTGELVSRLGNDTTLLQTVVSLNIPEVLTGLVKSITAIILMFMLNAKLAGVSLGGVIVIFLLSVPLGKSLGSLSKAYQDELGTAQTHSTEALGAMRTVQSFAAERKEINRFEKKIGNPDHFPKWYPTMMEGDERSTYRVGYFKSLVNSGFFTLIFGGGFGFLYISLWYGFYLVNQGELTIGQLTAFQSYVFNIGFGLGQVGANAAKVFEGLGASGRVFYLVERIPTIPKPASSDDGKKSAQKSLKPATMEGNIEFENVKFSYPSRPDITVLDDFSLSIQKNTTTGTFVCYSCPCYLICFEFKNAN
jgi:ABC-type multidrug transport system fused ATPase/permease subunit